MKLRILFVIACVGAYSGQTFSFFRGSEEPVQDEYAIVNDLKGIAHITKIDTNRWVLKGPFEKLIAAIGYGTLAYSTYYGTGVINRVYNVNIPWLATAAGLAAAGIGAYALEPRMMSTLQKKATNYAALCRNLCIASEKFDSEESFDQNCDFSGYNNIWRGKSSLAIMRGIEYLLEQGRYATKLVNSLYTAQSITEEQFQKLSKEIGQYIITLEHNKKIYEGSARIQQGVQTASRAANWVKNMGIGMLALVTAQQAFVRAQTISLYVNTATDLVKNIFAGWQQIKQMKNND